MKRPRSKRPLDRNCQRGTEQAVSEEQAHSREVDSQQERCDFAGQKNCVAKKPRALAHEWRAKTVVEVWRLAR